MWFLRFLDRQVARLVKVGMDANNNPDPAHALGCALGALMMVFPLLAMYGWTIFAVYAFFFAPHLLPAMSPGLGRLTEYTWPLMTVVAVAPPGYVLLQTVRGVVAYLKK